ncbi:FYVE, RhoGEF and PH domain-containing protein [Dirofilaria immitis]
MHELSQIPHLNLNVKQIRSRLEHDQLSSCNNFIEQRKVLFEGRKISNEQNASKLKQKPIVARKPFKSPTPILSSVSPANTLNEGISEDGVSLTNAARLHNGSHTTPTNSNIATDSDISKHPTKVRSAVAFYDALIESGQMMSPTVFSSPRDSSLEQHSSMRSSVISDSSWMDLQLRSPLSSETESLCSEQSFYCSEEAAEDSNEKTLIPEENFESDEILTGPRKKSTLGQLFHGVTMEELKNNVFRGTNARTSKNVVVHDSNTSASSKIRKLKMVSAKQNLESNCESLLSYDSEATSSRPSSDAYSTTSTLCRTSIISPTRSSFDCSTMDIVYNTGCRDEDKRLKKLHYAAVEIYTVEKKFVEQLELLAVKYPEFLMEYGKELGIDFLKPLPNGHPHLISQIAQQLLMVKEAHKFLLEKISSKIENWDSRDPNMAECLKNGAGLLKCCLPYLKEKKKHVDDFIRLLQDNEELARATMKFEEQVMGKISIIQQLDIVHQNVVRYTILLEAYKKYLMPESDELEVCKEALVQLSKVSELVDRQISRAELEKRLIDLYRRLEGKFNVFEANRHLLFEGELMKQSRKDLQPRYLILFSDVLLICKYSRTPSLGTDANFHSEFYKFLVSRVRAKAEEHGEYETHFQLYTTQKSAVFIAKTKRERDDWVKRINEAKMEAKELRRIKIARNKISNVRIMHKDEITAEEASDAKMSNNGSDYGVSLNNVQIAGKHKYTPLWIPDPKATSCMMAGCSTKFSVLNRRHHCRECGYLICRSCVGYAPVKTNNYYMRSKVCPECYVKIIKKWKGEMESTIFTAPENESLTKTSVPSRNAEGVVSGTVFLRNQKGGENEKWGRLTSHADGVLVLCFYNAEFDVDPVARYVLLGFTFCVQELDDGGRLFELRHANQVNDRNSISLNFRVAHSGNAESSRNCITP